MFHALPRQVGGVFVINDEPVGLEVFDAPETFAAVFPQLVRSYALDALALRAPDHAELVPYRFKVVRGAGASSSSGAPFRKGKLYMSMVSVALPY